MEELENPIDDPYQPTVTEELLLIVEEFADYIDKFMFEIVTFLAVVDSSMGLVKDVLGVFGFAGWKMTFFPSFSFVVTMGVFLFGSNKRKGKRKAEAEQLEGLGQAMDMIEDVFEVMDDVMDEIEEVEGEAGALGLGDYSDSDDDDDDGNQGAIKAEENAIEETSENNEAVDKIDVVTTENNHEISQQDIKVEVEPPKSTLRKVIGIAIIAARIASKLAKKKQEDQQEAEKNDNVGGTSEGNDVGGESMAGTNAPPTDDKSKQDNKTSIHSTIRGLGLGEDGAEFKNEAVGLVEAVKEDSLKTAELVKAGSLGANNVVQGGTKQVLASTGALKVGHSLYREADFITGHLQKEGKTVAKSLEKDTKEKTKQIKDNEIVKATGVEKASTAVSREATFITGHVNQEVKKAIQHEDRGKIGVKQVPSTSESKRSLSSSQQGKKETAVGCKTQEVHPPPKTFSTAARQDKQTKGKTKSVSAADTSKQQQSIEIKDSEQGRRIPYEKPPTNVEKRFSDLSKTGDLGEENQGFEKGRKEIRKEVSKPLCNEESENLTESTAIKGEKEPKQARESEEIQEDPERLIPDPLPGTTPGMASNLMEGGPGAAGAAAAASQAKQGLQQTTKKSKGLLQIAMRLVRLIMRVAKKGGNSAPSSQNSSRRESTASGSGSLNGAPAKGKRSASLGGDGSAPDIAGAASAMGMDSGGAKGGKIGAIVGIVVRLVRLASKLKGGKQESPSSDMRSSKESIDQESDSEFFDCDEEFATQEIQTQTEDRFPLLSVATQTTNTNAGNMWNLVARHSKNLTDMRNDPGGTWTARESGDLRDMRNDPRGTWTARESGDLRDMRNDERKKDLTRYVKAFKADGVGPHEGASTDSQTKGQEEMYQSTSKEMPNSKHHETFSQNAAVQDNYLFEDQTRKLNITRNSRVDNQSLISRELRGTNSQELRGNDGESTPRRTSTGSLQRITLKILNSTDPSPNEATNNSLLLDIDAPVVLHSTREYRAPTNDVTSTDGVNMVASGNQQNMEEQTPREERRRSQKQHISREEFSGLRGRSFKSSSVDLDEMEKQTHQNRASTRRDLGADSREWSDGGSIVPYSSSSEDLEDFEPFFQRRRRTIVRFEDECEYSYAYDEDEPIASYREMKTRNRKERRSIGLKKYSSLENLDNRFPEDWNNGDDGLLAVRDSGCDQESTRLLSEHEKPTMRSGNISAARKSRLSSSRMSYFGDDEADQPGVLC